MWGLMFVAPLLLPGYPAALLAVGRYLSFGLIALPLGWLDRAELASLRRADWLEALKLAAVGNLLYYSCLAGAIQRAGAPLATLINGTLPVVVAIAANLRGETRVPWIRLLPSLLLIGAGIACVDRAASASAVDRARQTGGVLLAIGAVACWTWYPLRNAEWLRRNPARKPRTWTTAQGIAILPLALIGFLALWMVRKVAGGAPPMPLGPQPLAFVGIVAALALFSTWLGSVCWNQASRRLPIALAGQLMVFETLAALAYVFLLRRQWPTGLEAAGILLLILGVLWACRDLFAARQTRA
jgi:drug/metabolite transporter (DMT)-like permease